MTNQPKQNESELCSLCGRPGIKNVQRDKLYKGVWFESLSVKYCPHCHEEVCDWETVQMMEEVAAHPDEYTQMIERPVARAAWTKSRKENL
jgi:hypothetical protein